MTDNNIAETLFKTTSIGLVSGIAGGLLLYVAIFLNAQACEEEMAKLSHATYRCAIGTMGFLSALLCFPAGAISGFCLGGFFIRRKARAARRALR
jgi:hypothetical protein